MFCFWANAIILHALAITMQLVSRPYSFLIFFSQIYIKVFFVFWQHVGLFVSMLYMCRLSIIFICKTCLEFGLMPIVISSQIVFHTHKITFWIHHSHHPRQKREKLFDGIILILLSVTHVWSIVSQCVFL